MAACEALAASGDLARKAAHYFYTNAARMRYDRFRAAGYMIGSGTVAGAVQTAKQGSLAERPMVNPL